MDAKQRVQQIRSLLQDRELIYVGPRGVDALPLMALGSLGSIFSFIGPSRSGLSETCMEEISEVREDLNYYSLDDDTSEPATQFRDALFAKLSRPSAVVPYSSSRTLSRLWLTAQDTVLPLGLFYEHQSCFDHKPWVEREVRRWGIATIPWSYVLSLSLSSVTGLLDREGPVVIRWPRSRGGAGIWLVRDRADLDNVVKPPLNDALFCVAPYFETAVSVNVNACVFPTGEVSIHGSSVQLIGIEICTPRPLGYVGNDFSSIMDLPARALRDLNSMTHSLGAWLARHGYLGAFGFDALVLEDRVLFVELNPRFQASSALASRLDNALDRPNQYLNHIAAFLGLEASDRLSLPELAKKQEPLSHVIVYNSQGRAVALRQELGFSGRDIRLLPAANVIVKPQGTLAAILWTGRVTDTGRELREEVIIAVRELLNSFSSSERR